MTQIDDPLTALHELTDDDSALVSGGLPSMEGPGWTGTAIAVVVIVMVLI